MSPVMLSLMSSVMLSLMPVRVWTVAPGVTDEGVDLLTPNHIDLSDAL